MNEIRRITIKRTKTVDYKKKSKIGKKNSIKGILNKNEEEKQALLKKKKMQKKKLEEEILQMETQDP